MTSVCSPTSNSQTVVVTKPVQEYKRNTRCSRPCSVLQELLLNPSALGRSALLPYRISSNRYQTKSYPSCDDSHLNGGPTQQVLPQKAKKRS